ncbi:MAG TPA: SUMF1/EgtB/PvdO family nonheme iron enzyme, partial [Panacibacter sp.]|nr:SUMF1/EgtB/PvdO family nonheme iron enzyme [Panacibacter sp.]
PVTSFFANGFGLYNMSGNVNEWVADVYRPLTNVEVDDMNPYRGNVFTKMDLSGGQGNMRDSLGRMKYIPENDSDLAKRDNYNRSNVKDYLDGDPESKVSYGTGVTTLIGDKSRVIKGGSWMDMPFWLSPGTRRFMEEDMSSSSIGFRCAMSHFGPSEGTSSKLQTGNSFPKSRQKR